MRNWVIFGIVLLGIGLLFHYPWNAVIIVFLALGAFIRYRRQKNREYTTKGTKPPARPTPKPGTRGPKGPLARPSSGYVRLKPKSNGM